MVPVAGLEPHDAAITDLEELSHREVEEDRGYTALGDDGEAAKPCPSHISPVAFKKISVALPLRKKLFLEATLELEAIGAKRNFILSQNQF
jgi:hypothetical protein